MDTQQDGKVCRACGMSDLDGNDVREVKLTCGVSGGKTVEFFGSLCGPCREQYIDSLQRLADL